MILRPHPIAVVAAGALLLALAACSGSSEPASDAGLDDAGAPPIVACDSPEDCKLAGVEGACRQGVCKANVPCGADAECGLGESCVAGNCRFTGCTADADCATGSCRTEVYACTECGVNADCPAQLPVCSSSGRCIQCAQDLDCPSPGPGHCSPTGACVHCTEDLHCPNGLSCGSDGICEGAQKNDFCPEGIACDLGLTCVSIGGGNSICLEACTLYTPQCTNGEICIKLTFSDSASLVFDQGAPLGVCYRPINGARGYHENCTATICQPNLECIPDSAAISTCKAYCDPAAPFCASGEKCHAFPGDYQGRTYGVCYPDNGYHARCGADAECRAGLHCVPDDDPSAGDEVGLFCAFAAGPGKALEACTKNSDCGSNQCVADVEVGGAPSFCLGTCRDDADCAVGGRTGVCDGKYPVATQYASSSVQGCRTRCDSPADCAEYGANPGDYTCRPFLDPEGVAFDGRCAPRGGTALPGETCVKDADCRDGFCSLVDGRGVFRQGVCTVPCGNGAADCAGTSLACELVTVMPSPGVLNTGSMCVSPQACTSDGDCSGVTSECTADVDPAAAPGLTTVCRAPTGGTLEAGDACTSDLDCRSGACAELVPPSTGTGRTCLEPCVEGVTVCGSNLFCRPGAARLRRSDGTNQTFTACVP